MATPLRKQPETKFKERVQADLNTLENCYHVKIDLRALRGVPDLFLCVNGHFVAIELKVGKNKTDRLQDYNLAQISQAGGVALVSYPETWGDDFLLIKELANLPMTSYRLTLANHRKVRSVKI